MRVWRLGISWRVSRRVFDLIILMDDCRAHVCSVSTCIACWTRFREAVPVTANRMDTKKLNKCHSRGNKLTRARIRKSYDTPRLWFGQIRDRAAGTSTFNSSRPDPNQVSSQSHLVQLGDDFASQSTTRLLWAWLVVS